MRRFFVALTLLLTMFAHAQTTADSLVTRIEQVHGRQRLEVVNQLFLLLYDEEVTDSLLQFDERVPDDSLMAHVYYWVAEQKFFSQEYAESAVYFERASLLIDRRSLEWTGDCQNDLSIAYARLGLFSKALAASARCVEADEKLGDRGRLMVSLNVMASIMVMARQPAEALKYTRRSLDLARELKDSLKMGVRYGTLSEIYQSMGQHPEALRCAREAFAIDSLRGDGMRMAVRRVQMANALARMSRLREAEALLREANPVLRAAGNMVSLAICLNQQGYVALQQGRWAASADFYAQALPIYERTGDRNSRSVTLWGLAHSLSHIDPARAVGYMDGYIALKDSLYQEDAARMSADYNARYENDELLRQNREARQRNRLLMIGGGMSLLLLLALVGLLLLAVRLKSRAARMQSELARARDRFFTGVTHELRTPLTVINAATDELMRREENREEALAIRRQADLLLELVGQMLDIARLRSEEFFAERGARSTSGRLLPKGRKKAERGAGRWLHGDVVEIVSVVRESFTVYAASKGVTLVYSPSEQRVEMDFVADYLQKILRNLLSNAVKFADAGSVVSIVTEVRGGKLVLTVWNQGPVIAREELPHIFEPFYQASDGMRQSGSGIGLPLAKLCAEAMNGDISVESEAGQGTRFIVTLPLRSVGVSASPFDRDSLSLLAPPLAPAPSVGLPDDADAEVQEDATRLLIVEDSPEVATYVARLMPADYQVYFAADGEEALRKANALVPDLIVTDIIMPGMDGLALCREIREAELLSHIPVVMVTAKVSMEDRLVGLQAGADDYLEKPFSAEELRVRIENLLQQRRLLQKRYRGEKQNENGREQRASVEVQAAGLRRQDRDFLNRVDGLLRQQMGACDVSIERLASDLCITRLQLNRKMKALTGENMRDYVNRIRLEQESCMFFHGHAL